MKDFNRHAGKLKNKMKFVKTVIGDKLGRSEKSQTFAFLGEQFLKIYLNSQSVHGLIKKLYPSFDGSCARNSSIGAIGESLIESELLESSDMFRETFEIISSSLQSIEGFMKGYEEYLNTSLKEHITDNDENIYQPLEKHVKKLLELSITCKDFESNKNLNKSSKQAEQVAEGLANAKLQFENEENNVIYYLLNYEAQQTRTIKKFLEALETSYEMHVTSLTCLQNKLDQIGKVKNKYCVTPVFGLSLQEHAKIFKSDISIVFQRCFAYIYQECQYKTEGLFRVGCTSELVKNLKDSINDGTWNFDLTQGDVHVVAAVIKNYIKELPDDLLGAEKIEEWHSLSCETCPTLRMKGIVTTINLLNTYSKINLLYLCYCLNKVSEFSEENKMTPDNLAICISPNLLKIYDQSKIVKYTSSINFIVKELIENYKEYFPNDDFDKKMDEADFTDFDS